METALHPTSAQLPAPAPTEWANPGDDTLHSAASLFHR